MTIHPQTPRRLAAMTRAGMITLPLLLAALISCSKSDKAKTPPIGPVPVATVVVAPASATIATGGTTTLTATCKAADGDPLTGRTVTWTSNHVNLATVDGNGMVTGVAAGDVVITATCEGVGGTSNITVSAVPVASVAVTPASATIDQNSTVQLTATPKDGGGTPLTGRLVTWSSDNLAAATVNGSGKVTGVTPGTANVTATCEGKTGTSAITVNAVAVASVDVSPPSASVSQGSTVQLTATPKSGTGTPLTGRTITWSSDNTAYATVNGSGLVTGVAVGPANITATCEGKSGSSAITVTAAGTSFVLMGAGDIAIGDVYEQGTADLIKANPSAVVFTAGDNAYPDGTASDYTSNYAPSWGAFKSRTLPCPGNHDYHVSGAADYFAYFGAQAGPSGRGYYSYDIGDWHLISLDSEIDMSPGSPQETWLRADLAASSKECQLAYWHRPLFSSGDIHGNQTDTYPLYKALQDAHAEIVVCGHDHEYERFAPQTADGVADPNGIREFVCGTGGANLYTITNLVPNSEAHNTSTYGVLKLTLGVGTYSWQFMPIPGGTFTDSGSGVCHK